ncbi:MAG TPA: helix-turn-helix domain-containing protein [Alphaproteobacteria bacterium]|nr:helix-turn-helix domain-containing protein [Alphaproteobacteria bacterium]
MTKIGDSILRGLEEAVAYAGGTADKAAYRRHVPERVDVRAIRGRLGLTQAAFCARFGFSLDTLRKWEQGVRQPEGPARAYLKVIDRNPAAVEAALSDAAQQP